ncbi:hypothetical protein HPB50_005317 [Hyalomma asiaticum]|uniref:Uncharacterized protein n=1 Tax=Hyalomma asiaticum TaxID=266040 RepID=A0ACB7SCV6_HYAAI|nr:hypothetical protein HPB50_005317 [Hyalomma asiaticum]
MVTRLQKAHLPRRDRLRESGRLVLTAVSPHHTHCASLLEALYLTQKDGRSPIFIPLVTRRMEDKIPVPRWKKALKPVLATATPLVLLPIPLSIGTDASWVAFVTLWMGIYYVVEPVPLSVTSLLPIVLLPFLGILSTEEVASFYLNA